MYSEALQFIPEGWETTYLTTTTAFEDGLVRSLTLNNSFEIRLVNQNVHC